MFNKEFFEKDYNDLSLNELCDKYDIKSKLRLYKILDDLDIKRKRCPLKFIEQYMHFDKSDVEKDYLSMSSGKFRKKYNIASKYTMYNVLAHYGIKCKSKKVVKSVKKRTPAGTRIISDTCSEII